MIKKKIFVGLAFSLISGFSFAQQEEGQINPNSLLNIPRYEQLYKVKVWRTLDLNEKQNKGFFAKGNEITGAFVTLGKPLELYVTGDHAYVVTRDDLTYKVKGKLMKQTGSIHTVVLHKSSSGWRITGEVWASTASAAPANN